MNDHNVAVTCDASFGVTHVEAHLLKEARHISETLYLRSVCGTFDSGKQCATAMCSNDISAVLDD
jgi:hypothetical protein